MSKSIEDILRKLDRGEYLGEGGVDGASKDLYGLLLSEVVGKTQLEKAGGHYTHKYPLNMETSVEDGLRREQRQKLAQLFGREG